MRTTLDHEVQLVSSITRNGQSTGLFRAELKAGNGAADRKWHTKFVASWDLRSHNWASEELSEIAYKNASKQAEQYNK